MFQKNKETEKQYIIAFCNSPNFASNMNNSKYFTLPSQNTFENFSKKYVSLPDNETIIEIRKSEQKEQSLFLGNYVIQDGSYFFFTEVDPLILMIPFLIKTKGKVNSEEKGRFVQIESVFQDDQNNVQNGLNILKENKRIRRTIEKICDVQKIELCDQVSETIRFNNDKLNTWIDEKLERAIKLIEKKQENFASNMFQEEKYNGENFNDNTFLALTLVYDYLPNDLFNHILKRKTKQDMTEKDFIDFRQVKQKRAMGIDDMPEYNENKTPNVPKKQIKQKSQQQVKMENSAKNTKSITSFFTKK